MNHQLIRKVKNKLYIATLNIWVIGFQTEFFAVLDSRRSFYEILLNYPGSPCEHFIAIVELSMCHLSVANPSSSPTLELPNEKAGKLKTPPKWNKPRREFQENASWVSVWVWVQEVCEIPSTGEGQLEGSLVSVERNFSALSNLCSLSIKVIIWPQGASRDPQGM